MSYADVAMIAPSSSSSSSSWAWQATLQAATSRGQLRAVWATATASSHGPAMSPARDGGGGTTASSSSLGTPQRGPRTGGTDRNEPGHHEQDLAVHGDLERHCGAPWFS